MPEASAQEDARAIHDTILALDAHLDIEATFFTHEQPEVSGWQKLASLEKIEEGCLGAAFFVAYTDQGPLTGEGYARAYETVPEKIDTIRRVLDGPLQAKIGSAPGQPEPLHGGLSAFGRQVVVAMNELGCIIDVAHISKDSVLDVCRLSKAAPAGAAFQEAG